MKNAEEKSIFPGTLLELATPDAHVTNFFTATLMCLFKSVGPVIA